MLAPTSSNPPNGITRKTLRERVALELPVALVMLRGAAIERAGATFDAAPLRLEPERDCDIGRAGERPPVERGTRRGLGFAIIDCFQVFVSDTLA